MKYTFERKFADKQLDDFINAIYQNNKLKPSDSYFFDLSEVEYIANQELLVFSAVLKEFITSAKIFQVQFLKPGIPTSQIDPRIKRQIIQIWEVWRIWEIIPGDQYIKYFGIDGNTIQRLKVDIGYKAGLSEIYTRNGVTPFVSLDYVRNYNQIDVNSIIKPIYNLNSAIIELLQRDKCFHPFASKSLSTIITEELYLNFLDHTSKSLFDSRPSQAYMSICFQGRLNLSEDSSETQSLKKLNFETEQLPESKTFYYDSGKKEYKNIPYLQFSFLDFGNGIVQTLQADYLSTYPEKVDSWTQDDVLSYAFEHNSSRHPINVIDEKDSYFARGLFDVLTLVKRYQGLLVVRSNQGKLLYDFSSPTTVQKSFFKSSNYEFPGTLLSIYIPALEDPAKFNFSTIKPEIYFLKNVQLINRYISFSQIAEKVETSKEILYSNLINELRNVITQSKQPSRIFLSFEGCKLIDTRLQKKALQYLLSSFDVNNNNNVVILGLTDDQLISEVEIEILSLSAEIQQFKIHPLPILNYNYVDKDFNLRWLGIFNEQDKRKLNELLFEDFSLSKSDFDEPHNIEGHINHFDSYGNLKTNFPSNLQIEEYYNTQRSKNIFDEIDRLLKKHNCISYGKDESIFLCNANYYQRVYIELTNLVNDRIDGGKVAYYLFNSIQSAINISNVKFIGVTSNSHKILKSMEQQSLITKEDYFRLDSYQALDTDPAWESISGRYNYILICDVIATGYLTQRIQEKLRSIGSELVHVAVIVNTFNPDHKFPHLGNKNFNFNKEFSEKLTYLFKYSIERFSKEVILDEILEKNIIRVNPHNNIPITLSINETNFDDSVIFNSKSFYDGTGLSINISHDFLNLVPEEAVKVGYYKFNNLIHPYFFDTTKIFDLLNDKELSSIFKKINKPNIHTEPIKVFFPRKSGIENFNIEIFKEALGNYAVEEIEVERIGTPEGWKFPHNSNYLSRKIDNNICFILDDGSCSGDSLVQMIDEITFYNAREIYLLCFIGRIADHKREFLSRLSHIKAKDKSVIELSIYFVSHWHIPTYYIDENPNSREIRWLQEIIDLKNTPQIIKSIAGSIKAEISPKGPQNFTDYKYLPKLKPQLINVDDELNNPNSNNLLQQVDFIENITKQDLPIPKKDILLIREELGKVIGYRLYIESFEFFNFFFKKYAKIQKADNRYKEIELLCATLIYEPYLFGKISHLPDIVDQIKEFVKILILSNESIYKHLTYTWDKKDMIHLFFIVFKDKELFDILMDIDNFKKLLAFTNPASSLHYVLYKLLYYIPIKSYEFEEKRHDAYLRNLIEKLLQEDIAKKSIKKFYNYISTLPSREDYEAQINKLKIAYSQNEDEYFHDEKKSFNHNVSQLIADLRTAKGQLEKGGAISENRIDLIRRFWFDILDFINPILTFSSSFNDFLIPYPYFILINKLEMGSSSLRLLVGENEQILFSLTKSFKDGDKLDVVINNAIKIQNDFGLTSTFRQIVDEPTTNLVYFLENLTKEITGIAAKHTIDSIEAIDKSLIVNIPKKYVDLILKRELITNLQNHSNLSLDIACFFHIDDEKNIVITLKNEIAPSEYPKSNGEGIKCIKLMAAFQPFKFRFDIIKTPQTYSQVLTFKCT